VCLDDNDALEKLPRRCDVGTVEHRHRLRHIKNRRAFEARAPR
jgi:hypothetical protein